MASITPASQTVDKGTVVTLSAAGSTDSDGSIASYLWSTGATTPSIAVTVNQTQTISVTVTDNQGATNTAQVTLTLKDTTPVHNFAQLYFRGTPNAWVATPMTLVAANTWRTSVVLDGQANQRFKFDVKGDWSQNYGDTNKDGKLDLTGSDIYTTLVGTCVVEVNDATLAYQVTCPVTPKPPVAVVTPTSTTVSTGSSVTFSAAGSTDSDGTIQSYSWNTGETTSSLTRTFTAAGTYTVTVTVTDNDGQTSTASSVVTVQDVVNFKKNLAQLYFRGTPNSWGKSAMTLVADNTWQVNISFSGAGDANGAQRFKLDVNGDWATNYGDNNADGVAEKTGKDIVTSVVGTYKVTFNDSTLKYSISAQ